MKKLLIIIFTCVTHRSIIYYFDGSKSKAVSKWIKRETLNTQSLQIKSNFDQMLSFFSFKHRQSNLLSSMIKIFLKRSNFFLHTHIDSGFGAELTLNA